MGRPSNRRIAAKRTGSSPRLPQRAPAAPDDGAGDSAFALVDQVYVAIRDAIRERSLVPGERLVEREIADWLGVSRTPVREALRLLEAHGLASTLAGAGLVVTSLSRSEVSELYFAWEELEAGLCSTAAPVRGVSGTVIAAISVSAPTVRTSRERLAELSELVRQEAAALSDHIQLSHPGDRGA